MSEEIVDKIVKGTTKVLTHESCDICPDTLGFLGKADNFQIPVELTEVKHSTDDGQKWIETGHLVDAQGNLKTPQIIKCDVYESGKEECKEISGFNESDFESWRKKAAAAVTEQIKKEETTDNPTPQTQ